MIDREEPRESHRNDLSRSLCVLPHRQSRPHEADHGLLCADHAARCMELLRDILDLYGLVMADAAIPLPAVQSDGRSGEVEAAAPGRLSVMALTDPRNADTAPRPSGDQEWWAADIPDIPNVPGTLANWARTVCDERDLAGSTLDGTVARSVAFLTTHREWIYRQPWVDEWEAEMRALRTVLAAMLGQPRPKPVGRCPSQDGDGQPCGGSLWPDQFGRMEVTCSRCDRVFAEVMLRHLGGMLTA